MALIKSNLLVQQGNSVVVGDKIVQETTVPVRPSEKKRKSENPEQPEKHTNTNNTNTNNSSSNNSSSNNSNHESVGAIEKVVEAKPSPEGEPPVIQGPLETSENLLRGFDEKRDEILAEGGESLENLDFERQSVIGARMGDVLEERTQEFSAAVVERQSDEESREIIGRLMPYIEHQASAEAEKKLLEEFALPKWQVLGTFEEKIAAFLDGYVKKLAKEPSNQDKFLQLLSEREAILAEARFKAHSIVQGAEQAAAGLVEEAEARAAQTILDVENNRQDILTELEQQGYSQGYQEGRSQADQEGAEVLSQAIETLNKVRMAYPQAIKDNEENLLKLAIKIAERIIQEEISIRPEICRKTLETAIRRVSDLEHVIIKANEEDLPFLLEREEQFRERLKNVKNLEFVASSKVARGGILIETTAGAVDAQISTQLSVVKEAFDRVRAEFGDSENDEDAAWEEVNQ